MAQGTFVALYYYVIIIKLFVAGMSADARIKCSKQRRGEEGADGGREGAGGREGENERDQGTIVVDRTIKCGGQASVRRWWSSQSGPTVPKAACTKRRAASSTLSGLIFIRCARAFTVNPQPQTLNLKLQTPNPKPQTLNPVWPYLQ